MSALDIFNVNYTLMEDTTFSNCSSAYRNGQYRANGGAVSVAYSDTSAGTSETFPTLDILRCSFDHNSVVIPKLSFNEAVVALVNNTYYGRGGAICIVLQGTRYNVRVQMKNTTFFSNLAEAFGGAVCIIANGNDAVHDLYIQGCNFTGNIAKIGGGVQTAFLLQNLNNLRPSRLNILDSYFEGNLAQYGGGLNVVEVSRCSKYIILILHLWFLLPPKVSSNNSGNEVSVTSTQFVANLASNAGAAIMLQNFAYVQIGFEKFYYNFTDW